MLRQELFVGDGLEVCVGVFVPYPLKFLMPKLLGEVDAVFDVPKEPEYLGHLVAVWSYVFDDNASRIHQSQVALVVHK